MFRIKTLSFYYKRVLLVGAHRVPSAIELQTWVWEILLSLLTSILYIYICTTYYIVPTDASEVTTQTSCLYISAVLYLYIPIYYYCSVGILYDCIKRVYIYIPIAKTISYSIGTYLGVLCFPGVLCIK